MVEFTIEEKALSVNKCWQGKRYKTTEYKEYESKLLTLMPKKKVDAEAMLCIEIFFGYKNKLADIDNGLKPLLDILQKKYGFNDRNIFELNVRKAHTEKDFIQVTIKNLLPFE